MINVRIQTPEVQKLSPKITVVGVGGAGGNAVNNMISSALEGCEFLVCNTDAQALEGSLCENRLQLGASVTGGLGAGAKPEIGEKAAHESLDDVMQYLDGANMAFITAGMGGGTGTGAAPVIAKACRDSGILTVGVVTKPFHFEGTHRMTQAEAGIKEMQDYVDTLIVIPNQNLFRIANEKTTFAEAFKMADGVLQSGVRGVTDLMVMPGLINLDFADIRSAMLEMGKAMMGTGEGEGENRATEAAEAAINNPLLDDVSMKGARGVIINVTGGHDMTLFEVDEACNRIRDEVDPNANIIFGSTFDEKLEGSMRVSVVATGIDVEQAAKGTRTTGGIRVTAIGKSSESTTQKPAASQPQPHVAKAMTLSARKDTSSAKTEEPETDMFEQNEFSSTSRPAPQSSFGGPRGSIYQGSFIPPSPVMPEVRNDIPSYSAPSYQQSMAAPQQTAPAQTNEYKMSASSVNVQPQQQSQPQAQPQQATQQQMPSQQQSQGGSNVQQPSPQSGLVLRPPVPGAAAAERRGHRTPTLFERITGAYKGVMPHGGEEEAPQETAPSGGFHSGLRAERTPQSPSQGQLNIDSPSAPQSGNEDNLDIPAFLRRQAN
jgi:cell division protein FtsZ